MKSYDHTIIIKKEEENLKLFDLKLFYLNFRLVYKTQV